MRCSRHSCQHQSFVSQGVETTGDETQGLILDDEETQMHPGSPCYETRKMRMFRRTKALHCMKSMQALASEMQGWAAIKSR